MTFVVGWDVGGANVKATGLCGPDPVRLTVRTASLSFEIWRARERLPEVLAAAFAQVALAQGALAQGALGQGDAGASAAMAVTMTAELADVFATKSEGVLFVLDSLATAFPGFPIYVLSLDGAFVPLADARQHPLHFAAANWLATALWLVRRFPQCLAIDVGSTTADIIPIVDGQVAVSGRTDLDRLSSGELVYTGALRTNVAAIAQTVPVRGAFCPVASEYFAVSGDAHLVLGHLAAEDYTCPTPDGRDATRAAARGRLARVVCADTDALSEAEIDAIARYVYELQVAQIGRGISQVLSRLGGRRDLPAVTLGLGAFLARAAAARLGLQVVDYPPGGDQEASLVAPSWAVAHLLAEQLWLGEGA